MLRRLASLLKLGWLTLFTGRARRGNAGRMRSFFVLEVDRGKLKHEAGCGRRMGDDRRKRRRWWSGREGRSFQCTRWDRCSLVPAERGEIDAVRVLYAGRDRRVVRQTRLSSLCEASHLSSLQIHRSRLNMMHFPAIQGKITRNEFWTRSIAKEVVDAQAWYSGSPALASNVLTDSPKTAPLATVIAELARRIHLHHRALTKPCRIRADICRITYRTRFVI